MTLRKLFAAVSKACVPVTEVLSVVTAGTTMIICVQVPLSAFAQVAPAPDISPQLKAALAIITCAVALVTLVKAVIEYNTQGKQKRTELYLAVRRKFDGDDRFTAIRNMLDEDDPALANISVKDRSDYAAYFEEVAVLMNSGLLSRPLAFYMFGIEALQCWYNDHFWTGFVENRKTDNAEYVGVFRQFVVDMEKEKRVFPNRSHRLHI